MDSSVSNGTCFPDDGHLPMMNFFSLRVPSPYDRVTCRYCKHNVRSDRLEEHIKNKCVVKNSRVNAITNKKQIVSTKFNQPNNHVSCPYCKQGIRKDRLQTHINKKCSKFFRK